MHTSRLQQHPFRAYDRTTYGMVSDQPRPQNLPAWNAEHVYRYDQGATCASLPQRGNEAKPCTDVEGVSDQRKDVADSPQSEAVEPKARRTKNNCQRTSKVEKEREREKSLQSISTVLGALILGSRTCGLQETLL